MRRWSWLAALVLLASACGGGTSDGDTAATGVSAEASVESADGLATLVVQPGSLPGDIEATDISVEVLINDQGSEGEPIVLIQLAPGGLVLAEPAVLTVTLPDSVDEGVMALHVAGDSVDFVDGTILHGNDTLSYTAPIEHFSRLYLWKVPYFQTTVRVSPESVVVDADQTAAIEVTPSEQEFTASISFSSDPERTRRELTFSVPRSSIEIVSSFVWWQVDHFSDESLAESGDPESDDLSSEFWSPYFYREVLAEVATGWETGPLIATCLQANTSSVVFDAVAHHDLILLERSEPLSWFGTYLAEAFFSTEELATGGGKNLLTLPLLGTIEARSNLFDYSPSRCTDESSGTTTTTTTTTTEAVSGSGTTTTTQPPAPASLQAVVPTSVVSVVDDRTVQIEIEFPEGAQAVAEGLHLFEVTAHVFGENLRVTGLVRSTDGEILVDGRSVQDVPAEDGSMTVVTKNAQVLWEWSDGNHFLMTITTEDVAVPGTAPQVSVVVQETPDTDIFTFNA